MYKRKHSNKGSKSSSFKGRYAKKGTGMSCNYSSRYSHTRSTGRFAGRPFRRTYKGGKWYRRYPRKPFPTKIVTNGRHVYPFSRVDDRKHFKLTNRGFGQQAWIGDANYLGYTLQMSPVEWATPGWPTSSAGHTGAWFNDGTNSTFSYTTGMSTTPGSGIVGACYRYLWVSGIKISWEVARDDHSDDAVIEIGMVPLLYSQQASSPAFAGTPPYTTFNSVDSNDLTRWSNFKMQPGAQFRKMSSTYGGHYKARVSAYIPVRKFVQPGFPTASNAYWLSTNSTYVNGWTYTAGTASSAATYFPYIHFGLFSVGGGVGNYDLEHRMSITWFMTAFEPIAYYVLARNQSLGMFGDGTALEVKEPTDSKDDDFSEEDLQAFASLKLLKSGTAIPKKLVVSEGKEEKKEDPDTDDDIDFLTEGLHKKTPYPTPPPSPSKPTSSSSSSSSSSSLKTLLAGITTPPTTPTPSPKKAPVKRAPSVSLTDMLIKKDKKP